jgi:YD repeat-containing protein
VPQPLLSSVETPIAQSWYSSVNQITSWGYDAGGNITSVAVLGRSSTYDAENRQISVALYGQTTTYAYDGDGHRVQRVTSSGTTAYVYDAQGQLAVSYSTMAQKVR